MDIVPLAFASSRKVGRRQGLAFQASLAAWGTKGGETVKCLAEDCMAMLQCRPLMDPGAPNPSIEAIAATAPCLWSKRGETEIGGNG